MSLEVFGPGKGKKNRGSAKPSSTEAPPAKAVVIPLPGVPKKAPKTGWKKWVGPCASIACLVHCFALPVFLLLAPPFVHTLSSSWIHQAEWGFWAVALLLGLYTLKHSSVPRWALAVFTILSLGSPYALLNHNHNLAHLVLMFMASYQFLWVVGQHLKAKRASELECCDHG